jgi:hypothetical protein
MITDQIRSTVYLIDPVVGLGIAPLSAYAMRCASVGSECRHDSRMSGDAIFRSLNGTQRFGR